MGEMDAGSCVFRARAKAGARRLVFSALLADSIIGASISRTGGFSLRSGFSAGLRFVWRDLDSAGQVSRPARVVAIQRGDVLGGEEKRRKWRPRDAAIDDSRVHCVKYNFRWGQEKCTCVLWPGASGCFCCVGVAGGADYSGVGLGTCGVVCVWGNCCGSRYVFGLCVLVYLGWVGSVD